jgi:ABC-type uncharacterized transport system YnjBCD ATPase subunit
MHGLFSPTSGSGCGKGAAQASKRRRRAGGAAAPQLRQLRRRPPLLTRWGLRTACRHIPSPEGLAGANAGPTRGQTGACPAPTARLLHRIDRAFKCAAQGGDRARRPSRHPVGSNRCRRPGRRRLRPRSPHLSSPTRGCPADFKSYRGHATVGPLAEGLTCVVGPNGGGKSVVVGAVRGEVGGSLAACGRLGTRGMRLATLGALNLPHPPPRSHIAPWGTLLLPPERHALAQQLHSRMTPHKQDFCHASQGEAIAFALGGGKGMLRAKSLASLINQAAREQDGATHAQVGGGTRGRVRLGAASARRQAAAPTNLWHGPVFQSPPALRQSPRWRCTFNRVAAPPAVHGKWGAAPPTPCFPCGARCVQTAHRRQRCGLEAPRTAACAGRR